MTEQAAVGSRMLLRQQHFALAVTFAAVLFRLFFIYSQKLLVILIMRQMRRGLWRCIPEKQKNAAADCNKEQIINKNIFFLFFFSHEDSRWL